MFGFIAHDEPPDVKAMFSEAVPASLHEFGADLLFFFPWGRLGIQRKTVPDDLLASLEDGRLQQNIEAMKKLELGVFIWEGEFRYNRDGNVLSGPVARRYTKLQVANLERSIRYAHGLHVEHSHMLHDTHRVVMEMVEFLAQPSHLGLHRRPSPAWDWGVPTDQEQVVWFYQGIPGIGPGRARALVKRFPKPVDLALATVEDIQEIQGIDSTAKRIYMFLTRQGAS